MHRVRNPASEDYDSMIENESDSEEDSADSAYESPGVFVKTHLKRKLETEDALERKAKMMKQLYKPPTVDEINRLKETENFYHSNLFRMQVEELLKEVKIPRKYEHFIEEWMLKFRKILKKLKDKENAVPFKDIQYTNVVYPLEKDDIENYEKDTFLFQRQKEVHLIGSQKHGTNMGKPLVVDLCVEMPEKCFRKEDYLNLRYHHKRAHFLCHIAEALHDADFVKTLNFRHLKGDTLKPVLEIVPNHAKYAEKICFRLHVVCPEKFRMNRFHPEKNNLRANVVLEESDLENELFPTPHLNYSVLYDMLLLKNEKILESCLQSDSIKDAIVLLKVWAKQRDFDKGFFGIDGALITFYIVYLLQNKKIYNQMSSYQVIRLFWNSLTNSSWDKKGITLCPEEDNVEKYQKYYQVVFLDSTGIMNICSNLSVDLYLRFKKECANAIHLLDNKKMNSFHLLFLTKYPFYSQYDHILSINNARDVVKTIESFGKDEDKVDYYKNWYPHMRKMLADVLRRGLGDRVQSITCFQMSENPAWPASQPQPEDKSIHFGLILNPTEAFNIVDKGPEATNLEVAEDFRSFWGGKSELRRFKDGSITESCVWGSTSDPLGEKRLYCRNICLHLLNVHFDLTGVEYFADQFDVAIRTCNSVINETNEEKSLKCIRSFDNLGRILKNLDGLPLQITSLLGVDPVFRYSAVDPPLPKATSYEIDGKEVFLSSNVIECILQLESSGKWPEKLEAIQRLKAAFYLQIAKCISEQAPSLKVQASFDYLDIIYDQFLFRLRSINQREINLHKEYVSEKNNITRLLKDTESSIKLEIQSNLLPKLTSVLHGLQQQYMSFGAVVCMAKRWLYSQLIDSFLWPDEVTELIVASLYMKQEPTIQPQTGFLRFLDCVANTDWSKEMILLNFNEELSEESVEKLEKQFATKRSSFPPLCLVTACDGNKPGIFAKQAPAVEILHRVAVLAKHMLSIVETNIHLYQRDLKKFFTPSYTGYNLVIHLEDELCPEINIFEVEDFGKVTTLTPRRGKDPAAGFYPVQFYLKELREAYKNFALFFYDQCGGNKIAVLWKPDALAEKNFASSNINGRFLKEENVLKLNTEAIINDFEIIGKGLVSHIERKN